MGEPIVGGVGTRVWVDNLRSAFHGKSGAVREITDRMVIVDLDDSLTVAFLGGELRGDRFVEMHRRFQIQEC